MEQSIINIRGNSQCTTHTQYGRNVYFILLFYLENVFIYFILPLWKWKKEIRVTFHLCFLRKSERFFFFKIGMRGKKKIKERAKEKGVFEACSYIWVGWVKKDVRVREEKNEKIWSECGWYTYVGNGHTVGLWGDHFLSVSFFVHKFDVKAWLVIDIGEEVTRRQLRKCFIELNFHAFVFLNRETNVTKI